MNTCVNHPDREARGYCAKHDRYLCNDCMKCQDPGLYCKFRKQCIVWEFERHGMGDDFSVTKAPVPAEAPPPAKAPADVKVTFTTVDKEVTVPAGMTIYEAAREADVFINATCGGKGACGKCKVHVESGEYEMDSKRRYHLSERELANNWVLACQAYVKGDINVEVPDEAIYRKMRISEAGEGIAADIEKEGPLSPMVEVVKVEMPPPSLDDSVSDLKRLMRAIEKAGIGTEYVTAGVNLMRQLPKVLRDSDWKVKAILGDRGCSRKLVRVLPDNDEKGLWGVAIDMGTTSIVVYLVDMTTGKVAGVSSSQNAQVACGDDVISRIICASNPEGLQRLNRYGIETINELIIEVSQVAGIEKDDIVSVVVAGNTVMTQSLLMLDPSYIRREPYVPVSSSFSILEARDINIYANVRAPVFIMPGIAAYVGGDITAGIIHTGVNREEPISLFIDVGTNGEMVLGNKDWLIAASCSTGPAFEGGGLKHGMRAIEGAIDRVEIGEGGKAEWKTVGDAKPRGICGSGVIALLAGLYRNGILSPNGRFEANAAPDYVRKTEGGAEYVIAEAGESAMDEDVVLTEEDVRTLIQSKAAVYGGIETLLGNVGMPIEAVDRIYIAGGFGKHLDTENCVTIGMLPDIEREKYSYLGNTSIMGAYKALLFEKYRHEANEVSESMTYVDFSSSDSFFQEYQASMFIPHTSPERFPSVKRK